VAGQAFGWAVLAAAALLIGALLALLVRVGRRPLGLAMAFGAGVLISAVAFELVQEAFATAGGRVEVAVGLAAGALVFYVGDTLLHRLGGADRKRSHGGQAGGSALAIVLGTVLDGVPESIVLGLSLLDTGTVGLAVLAAVFLSNLAESLAATTGLRTAGWRRPAILGMWTLVVVVCGLAALVGVAALAGAPAAVVAFMLAFAGGAILTMLADTMMPEAFDYGGRLVGLLTTLGFGLAFALSVQVG
jgi:zinc transporter, ZIP family